MARSSDKQTDTFPYLVSSRLSFESSLDMPAAVTTIIEKASGATFTLTFRNNELHGLAIEHPKPLNATRIRSLLQPRTLETIARKDIERALSGPAGGLWASPPLQRELKSLGRAATGQISDRDLVELIRDYLELQRDEAHTKHPARELATRRDMSTTRIYDHFRTAKARGLARPVDRRRGAAGGIELTEDGLAVLN